MRIDNTVGAILVIMYLSACNAFESGDEVRVKYLLKDASSAEFRNQRTGSPAGSKDENVYCGEVNSKNAFGAMVGFTRYVVIGNAVLIGNESGVYVSGYPNQDKIQKKMEDLSARLTIQAFESRARLNKANLELMSMNIFPQNQSEISGSMPTSAIDVAWEKHCEH